VSISIQDVEHVAKLARLDLSEEEKQTYMKQLNAILQYADKLNELDTDQVEPTSHVMELVNVTREDERRSSWPIEQVMKNAPEEDEGQFKVPAVLD